MKIKLNNYSDLKTYLLSENLYFSYNLSILTLISSTLLFIINIIDEIPIVINNIYLYAIITIFLVVWLLVYNLIPIKYQTTFIYNLLFNIFLFGGTYLSLYSCISLLEVNGSITFFLILIFVINLFFLIDFKKSLLVLIPSSSIYIFNMMNILNYSSTAWKNLFDIGLYLILGFCFSIIKFRHMKESYLSNKKLLDTMSDLKKTNNKLMSHEKERTNFFADVSHELKTPINVIYSADQLLSQQLKNPNLDLSNAEKYTNCIKQNSFRLIRLINNLLDLTKIEASTFKVNLENINIVYSVENIVDSVVDFIKSKEINIIFDTVMEEKITAIDEDKLERIILNLLSNAVKFTNPGGTIFIDISEDDNNTIISIKDTGIGIDDSMKRKIFDRFVQIDKSSTNNSEGTGIGLSLVKSLMVLHDGDITLESKVGEGSKFTLYFPNKIVKSDHSKDSAPPSIRSYNNKIERIQIEFSDIYQ